MSKLYIIGNGFDCYLHGMETTYRDFRRFIIKEHKDIIIKADDSSPTLKEELQLIPSYGIPQKELNVDHQGFDYDENKVVRYIIEILDNCGDGEWSELEAFLGQDIYELFELEYVDLVNGTDNQIGKSIIENKHRGERLAETFCYLKKYFYKWVTEKLSQIDYNSIKKNDDIANVLKTMSQKNVLSESDCFYINFNYTYTLEKVYDIDSEKIWHIHGKVGDDEANLYFGHGNSLEVDSPVYLGAEEYFNELLQIFRKDTKKNIENNKNIFERLKDVTEIYSYGFSFGDVDVGYIDELCKYINTQNVTWYLNEYDSTVPKNISREQWLQRIEHCTGIVTKLIQRGFYVDIDHRW